MLKLTDAQMNALTADIPAQIFRRVREHLIGCFPEVTALATERQIDQTVEDAMTRGNDYGFATTQGYCHFVNFIMLGGPDFDRAYQDPRAREVRLALGDGSLGAADRLERVYVLLGEASEGGRPS